MDREYNNNNVKYDGGACCPKAKSLMIMHQLKKIKLYISNNKIIHSFVNFTLQFNISIRWGYPSKKWYRGPISNNPENTSATSNKIKSSMLAAQQQWRPR